MQDPRWPMLRTRLVHLWLLRGPRSTQNYPGCVGSVLGKAMAGDGSQSARAETVAVFLAINPPPCKTKKVPCRSAGPQIAHERWSARFSHQPQKRPETSTNVHQLMESVTTIPQQARDRLALPWANGFANPFMCLSHLSISLLFPSSLRLTTPLL